MTFIEKVKSVTIKNSPGEKARPEVWGVGVVPRYGGPGRLPALPVGQVQAPGGGGHPTTLGRARALGGQGWAQSILVPWKSSTRSLKSGSMRSEGRSPSLLAASLSAPREMRYLGCKGWQWGGGPQGALTPSPGSQAGVLRYTFFLIFPGGVKRRKPDPPETMADFSSLL